MSKTANKPASSTPPQKSRTERSISLRFSLFLLLFAMIELHLSHR